MWSGDCTSGEPGCNAAASKQHWAERGQACWGSRGSGEKLPGKTQGQKKVGQTISHPSRAPSSWASRTSPGRRSYLCPPQGPRSLRTGCPERRPGPSSCAPSRAVRAGPWRRKKKGKKRAAGGAKRAGAVGFLVLALERRLEPAGGEALPGGLRACMSRAGKQARNNPQPVCLQHNKSPPWDSWQGTRIGAIHVAGLSRRQTRAGLTLHGFVQKTPGQGTGDDCIVCAWDIPLPCGADSCHVGGRGCIEG